MAGDPPSEIELRMAEEQRLGELDYRFEYQKRKRKRLIGSLLVLSVILGGIVVVAIGWRMEGDFFRSGPAFFILICGGFLSVLIFSMFQMINWRCPRCLSRFRAQPNPRFCSNCGLRLRD